MPADYRTIGGTRTKSAVSSWSASAPDTVDTTHPRPRVSDLSDISDLPVIHLDEDVARPVWENGLKRAENHSDWSNTTTGSKSQQQYEALASVSEAAVSMGLFRVDYQSHLDGEDGGADISFPEVGNNSLWDGTSWNIRVRDWDGDPEDTVCLWPEHKTIYDDLDGYIWTQELTDGRPEGGMDIRVLGYIRSEEVRDLRLDNSGPRSDVLDRTLPATDLIAPFAPSVERDLSPTENSGRRGGPRLLSPDDIVII